MGCWRALANTPRCSQRTIGFIFSERFKGQGWYAYHYGYHTGGYGGGGYHYGGYHYGGYHYGGGGYHYGYARRW